jgi:hypothetical protein
LIGTGTKLKDSKAIDPTFPERFDRFAPANLIKNWSSTIMTPYPVADHHGCNLTREQTSWPVFDDHQEYRGHITFIQSTAIPRKVYEQLKLGDRTDITPGRDTCNFAHIGLKALL